MRAKKGFNLRDLCGEHIIVAEGKENIDFTNIISMNDSSAYLWQKVFDKDNFDEELLVNLLLEEYDIDKETAQKDVKELVLSWQKAEIVE